VIWSVGAPLVPHRFVAIRRVLCIASLDRWFICCSAHPRRSVKQCQYTPDSVCIVWNVVGASHRTDCYVPHRHPRASSSHPFCVFLHTFP
jgi:hypothetical protein